MEVLVPFDPQDLSHMAILLDVDGTLLDIAPSPSEVHVPNGLALTLALVSERAGGALALVSGRMIAELDDFFAPLQLPAIGGHGAEMRPVADGPVIAGRASSLDAEFKQQLKDIAARHPGVLVEDKGYSLALHYRQVPKHANVTIIRPGTYEYAIGFVSENVPIDMKTVDEIISSINFK